jgi:transcriptional regulator with XRE-family HTH domain
MARRRGDEFEDSDVFHELQGTVARRVKRLRTERELTLRELAAASGISATHVGLIEAGLGNISLLLLAKLAHALGVSAPDLFEGTTGGRSGVENTMSRLAGGVERVEKHLERRRDEFGRLADDLKEFLEQQRKALNATAPDHPKDEELPRRVRKTAVKSQHKHGA